MKISSTIEVHVDVRPQWLSQVVLAEENQTKKHPSDIHAEGGLS